LVMKRRSWCLLFTDLSQSCIDIWVRCLTDSQVSKYSMHRAGET
jgi:hypothetical protein